jgi:hypothetical protein
MSRNHICTKCGKEFADDVTRNVEDHLPEAQQTAQYKDQEDTIRKQLPWLCRGCNTDATKAFRELRTR